MKVSFFNFLLLISLLSVAGCGSQGKTVSLNVTGSFSISAAGYTGGLIAYGEGPNGARFSTTSVDGSSTLTTTIDDGAWKIYVVGWESLSTPVQKFKGTKYCGMTSVNLAFSDTNINIDVNAANCSNQAFQAALGVQDVFTTSCGAFYNYAVATNTYSPLTSSDTFCASLPDSQKVSHPIYKMVANNIQGKIISPGISTDCLSTSATGGSYRLDIPTKRVPFTVLTYSSLKDCQNLSAENANRFFFPQGLEEGNHVSFDHHFMVTAAPAARLVLPSSSTRRGFSPFMNVLPRILCSGGDCFMAPTTPLMTIPLLGNSMFDVNWDSDEGDDRAPVLVKHVKPSTFSFQICDPSVVAQLDSSDNFSISDCHIEDGHLKGTLNRNFLQCKNSADMTGMLDLYTKNNLIYTVNYEGGNGFKVNAYTKKGMKVHEIELGSLTSPVYQSIAVDLNQNIYVLVDIAGTTNLIFVSYDTSVKEYSSPIFYSPTHLAGAKHLEVTDLGTIVTAKLGSNNQLAAFTLATMNSPAYKSLELSTSAVVKKLLFKENRLWVMTNAGLDTHVYDYEILSNTINLPSTIPRYTAPGTSFASFHIGNTTSSRLFILLNSMTAPMKMMDLSPANTLTPLAISSPAIPNGKNILYVNNKIYTLTGTVVSKSFNTHELNTSMTTIASLPDTTSCQAKLSPVIDDISYLINVTSRREDSLKVVFEDSFRFLGIRTVPSPEARTYFRSLQTDNHDDKGRAEGMLNRASGMMGPDGIGGIINGFYPSKTCAEIKAMISSTGPIFKTFSLYDSLNDRSKTYSLSMGVSPTPVPSFLCNTLPCSTPFDLFMLVRVPGEEATELKINCTERLGSIESANNRDKKIRHDLTLWNTQVSNSMRYETYEIEDRYENGLNKKRITLTRLQKTLDNAVDVRSLELNRDLNYIQGRITELALNSGSGEITSSSIDTEHIAVADFNSTHTIVINGKPFSSIIQNEKFGSAFIDPAIKCMPQTTTNTLLSSITNCPSPNHTILTSSKNASLLFRLDSLESFSSGLNPPIYGIFTLEP